MKKIALLVFDIENNLGGILGYIQNLCSGLEENGCRVRIIYATWRDKRISRQTRVAVVKDIGQGLIIRMRKDRIHLLSDDSHTYPYRGKLAGRLKEELQEYDGVILVSSVPSVGDRHHRKNLDWVEVLEHGRPMIGIVHDCHWVRYSPRILKVRDRFTSLVAVHPAAYSSLSNYPGRSVCIVNPFDISPVKKRYEKRNDWICLTSWFKRWKHVDDGVRTAPYLAPVHLFAVGGGIEYHYMTATLKSREDYGGRYYDTYKAKIVGYQWKGGDPDFRGRWHGRNIFEVARNSGNFTYLGFKVGEALEEVQARCLGIVDFSYHYKWGEHFNRVIVEGMIRHCVPFARPYGISDNDEGKGLVFGPDSVVMIPEDASPKAVAEIIKSTLRDESLCRSIVRKNFEKLLQFDRKVVARNMLKLLQGRTDVGLLPIQFGRPDKKAMEALKEYSAIRRYPRTKRFPRLSVS